MNAMPPRPSISDVRAAQEAARQAAAQRREDGTEGEHVPKAESFVVDIPVSGTIRMRFAKQPIPSESQQIAADLIAGVGDHVRERGFEGVGANGARVNSYLFLNLDQ